MFMDVIANFYLCQLIFIFPLFLGLVICAYQFETKEKLTEIKINCNIYNLVVR